MTATLEVLTASVAVGESGTFTRAAIAERIGRCKRTVTRHTNAERAAGNLHKGAPCGRPLDYTLLHPAPPPRAVPQVVTPMSPLDGAIRSEHHPSPSHPWRMRSRKYREQVKAAQAARHQPAPLQLALVDCEPYVGASDYAFLPVDHPPP